MRLKFVLFLAAAVVLTGCAASTTTIETVTSDGSRVIERQTVIVVDFAGLFVPVAIPKPRRFNTVEKAVY